MHITHEYLASPLIVVGSKRGSRQLASSPEPRILLVAYNALTEEGEDPMFIARFGLLTVVMGVTMAFVVLIAGEVLSPHSAPP